jgi:hypothetical protein
MSDPRESDPHEIVSLPADGSSAWAGHRSLLFPSPDGKHEVRATYAGEPPHGDSYHDVAVDGVAFPGHAWGGGFAWSPCSRWFVCGWMAARWERKTIVIDVESQRFFVLPRHLPDFRVHPPVIAPRSGDGERYVFTGQERWTGYGNEG